MLRLREAVDGSVTLRVRRDILNLNGVALLVRSNEVRFLKWSERRAVIVQLG